MGDAKENGEASQNVPSAGEDNHPLVDAQIQIEPEVSSMHVPVEETSDHVENEKAEPPSEAKAEPPSKAKAEQPSETKAEQPSEAKAEQPSETKAEQPSETKAEPPSETKAEPPSKAKAEPPSEAKAETPSEAKSDPDMHAEEKGELPAYDKSVVPDAMPEVIPQQNVQNSENTLQSDALEAADNQITNVTGYQEEASGSKNDAEERPVSKKDTDSDVNACQNNGDAAETAMLAKPEACEGANGKTRDHVEPVPSGHEEPTVSPAVPDAAGMKETSDILEVENNVDEKLASAPADNGNSNSKHTFFLDADHSYDGNESGTEEEQSAFMRELENFFRERSMEFKPPKFYGEGLNCLKLWRGVTRLGGYDKVTSCKLWRQVGESFKPPKTCTTVSWTFRGFYEKALLDYERHKIQGGELSVPVAASRPEPLNIENQALVSGRARRDAAARAMQGWHSQRLLGNGEVSDPIIKDRNSMSMQKREKQLKSINLLKRKKPSYMDSAVKAARTKPSKPQIETAVIDIGPPADWVKINVQKTKDCFEVYALVPGLLREEVRVQSDPAGRLVISGEPEHANNPWGVGPFKKVVSLPGRIDPHQTSAVVTLHGQLFVRVPFEQSE